MSLLHLTTGSKEDRANLGLKVDTDANSLTGCVYVTDCFQSRYRSDRTEFLIVIIMRFTLL